jgi:hypothetical protein
MIAKQHTFNVLSCCELCDRDRAGSRVSAGVCRCRHAIVKTLLLDRDAGVSNDRSGLRAEGRRHGVNNLNIDIPPAREASTLT